MNLYEFEGKQLFEKHGIKIPRGIVVRREEKAGDVFSELNVSDVVVKAQVLSAFGFAIKRKVFSMFKML
ncbi:MAG: Succinyl-CoA synthetase, beta subunit [Candidatus Magasanikbacteria bacterium GW2011_GWD2_43_18]|nr:MAG: Succinyl-CoA synthetase, beta subunit [Candidatus Magasanikbacteria bacterium GW2011_GWD2_43_18]